MKLTFDEAIENHRKMWNWIADETEKRKRCIEKLDYFDENNIEYCHSLCFCCQYAKDNSDVVKEGKGKKDCRLCPVDWGTIAEEYDKSQCYQHDTLYDSRCKSLSQDDWQSAAKYAREIANLPSREEVREE